MKIVIVILLTTAVSGTAGSELFWMNVLSEQIGEAATVETEDAKDIPDLAADLGLKILSDLVDKANLTDTLKRKGPFTLFGPSDEAFKRLPKDLVDFLKKNTTILTELLKYHVTSGKAESKKLTNNKLVKSLEGKAIRINRYTKQRHNETETVLTASGRRVLKVDQEASNGVIHVVGGVLFPPPGSIAAVVVKAKQLSFLLKGLNKTGLLSRLDGKGPFTLFAPTDKSLARIPKKCLIRLFNDTAKLTKVLEYHVVPGTYYTAGLSCGDKLKTLEGDDVQVRFHRRGISVNERPVVLPDVTVTNGVIQVIDGLLFPKEDDVNTFCDDIMDVREKMNAHGDDAALYDRLDVLS